MDSIDLQGKKYISSKRAAKITGYAQDYIGQLARGEKVPATRIGRGWYVSEKEILKHAGKSLPEEKNTSERLEKSFSRGNIQTSNTRTLQSLQTSPKQTSFKTWDNIQYLSDNSNLIPESVKIIEKNSDRKDEIASKNITIPVRRIVSKPTKITSDTSRIDGLQSKDQNILKTEIRPSNQKKSRLSQVFLSASFGLAVLHVLLFVGSLGISTEWVVSPNSQLSTAYETDFSLILGYFDFIFFEGVRLIGDFINLFIASLDVFFREGLNFILNLLNIG